MGRYRAAIVPDNRLAMHMDLGYFPGAPTYLVSGYLFRVQAHSIIPLLPRVYIFGSLNLDNIISSPSPNKSLLEADSFVQLHLLMNSVNVGIFMARFPPIRVTRRMLRLGSVVPNAGEFRLTCRGKRAMVTYRRTRTALLCH